MADILSFKPKAPKPVPVRHIEGAAKCINCKREWQAIVEEEPGEEFAGWLAGVPILFADARPVPLHTPCASRHKHVDMQVR
jgi:hypothetical protein